MADTKWHVTVTSERYSKIISRKKGTGEKFCQTLNKQLKEEVPRFRKESGVRSKIRGPLEDLSSRFRDTCVAEWNTPLATDKAERAEAARQKHLKV